MNYETYEPIEAILYKYLDYLKNMNNTEKAV